MIQCIEKSIDNLSKLNYIQSIISLSIDFSINVLFFGLLK